MSETTANTVATYFVATCSYWLAANCAYLVLSFVLPTLLASFLAFLAMLLVNQLPSVQQARQVTSGFLARGLLSLSAAIRPAAES